LRAAGFSLSANGGTNGSTVLWTRYFFENPGTQTRAFDAVVRATSTFDNQTGMNASKVLLTNLRNGRFQ
jgi:hypothetical protein